MQILNLRLHSRVLFQCVDLVITLPDSVTRSADKRRVLYLLHGAGCDQRTWLQSREFTHAMEHRELIAVLPSAQNSDYTDWPDFGRGYDFPRFFFEELMPFVTSVFPASDKAADTYLAGQSMGGYGAALLGLMHPERFAGLGIYSASLRESAFLQPYRGRPSADFRADALARPQAFPSEYGPPQLGIKRKEINVIAKYAAVDDFLRSKDCMWNRLGEVSPSILPHLYVSCGEQDLFYPATQRLQARCRALGIAGAHFEYQPNTGHDEQFMNAQLEKSLVWFGI